MPRPAARPNPSLQPAKHHSKKIHPSWIFLLLCIGVIVADIFLNVFARQNSFENVLGRTVTLSAKIAKDPAESDSKKLNLTLENIAIDGHKFDGTIFTQVNNNSLRRSDIIVIEGELSEGFGNYGASLYQPTIKEIKRPDPGDIFLDFRDFFAQGIKDYLPEPQSGLGLGYLLGQKSGVDQELQEALRTVGLTHIIVASGAHLATLTGFAKKLGRKVSRFSAFLLSALLTICFIGITGLSPSMLRAGLVTFLSLIAWYFGRDTSPARIITIVAAITLLKNPMYLTDLAWLLSFAAFIGILIVGPAIVKFLYDKSRKPGFIASTLISSAASALTCSPLLLFFFGQISLISIAANLLVLPTVSIAMGLTFLTGLFATINFAPLAALTARLDLIILDYQIAIVNFFGSAKIFLITIDKNNPLVFLLYIPLMLALVLKLCYPKIKLRLLRKHQA